jgi:hypothetical protein
MKLVQGLPPFYLGLRIATVDHDFIDTFSNRMLEDALRMRADVLTFPDRPWMGETIKLPHSDPISIALLSFSSYEDWYSRVRHETRSHIRRGLRSGAMAKCVGEVSGEAASNILGIYRETPFRENRFFRDFYEWDLPKVQRKFRTDEKQVSVVVAWQERIVGVAHAWFKDQVAELDLSITSLQARDKVRGISNLLIAKMIESLAERGVRHFVYGKFGVLPSLETFKLSNGFRPCAVNYNCLLLTAKARSMAALGLHRRPDILFSKQARSILSLAASLQSHLPSNLLFRFHLSA